MWNIEATNTFARFPKKHKNNVDLLQELDKKISRLKTDPEIIGGNLSGSLHGYKSTRLSKNFRLIFSINHKKKAVFLEAIDHRKYIY